MNYIGIDVGAKGAMSIVTGSNIEFIDFDLDKYIIKLKSLEPSAYRIGVEIIHSMPRQGVKSMFSFGQRLGEIVGILKVLDFKYYMITPQQWQKVCRVEPRSGKDGIYKAVTKLYDIPAEQLTGSRGGLKDGRCDALGIAYATKQIKE